MEADAFERLYAGLSTLKHPEVIFASKTKREQLEAIRPFVMGFAQEPYSCRKIYHPGRSCSGFFLHKLRGSF